MHELSVKRVLWFSGSLVLGLVACAKTPVPPAPVPVDYGIPVDVEALVLEFPALKGRAITAPEYCEEFLRFSGGCRIPPAIDYRIHPGSTIDVEVVGEEDLWCKGVFVPPDGLVELPYVGVINIAGMMRDELAELLEHKYEVLVKRPQVLIHMRAGLSLRYDFNPTGGTVTVLWPDRPPEFHELSGRETVFGVVAPSELTDRHDPRAIRVLRRADKDPFGRRRIIFVDAYDFVADTDPRQDISLRPGDVVCIPSRFTIGGHGDGPLVAERQYLDGNIDLDALIDALDGR